jgi:hypothetical protein
MCRIVSGLIVVVDDVPTIACVSVANAGTAAVTKAVVATAVVLLPAVWVVAIVPVGRVGVPVKVGLAKGAKPEMDAPEGMVTVPVNVGLANGAREVSVG